MDKRSGRNEHPVLSGEESGKGEKTIDGMVGRKPTSGWTTEATVTRLNATFQLELQVETPPRGCQ